jgi:hypothetical protein
MNKDSYYYVNIPRLIDECKILQDFTNYRRKVGNGEKKSLGEREREGKSEREKIRESERE